MITMAQAIYGGSAKDVMITAFAGKTGTEVQFTMNSGIVNTEHNMFCYYSLPKEEAIAQAIAVLKYFATQKP